MKLGDLYMSIAYLEALRQQIARPREGLDQQVPIRGNSARVWATRVGCNDQRSARSERRSDNKGVKHLRIVRKGSLSSRPSADDGVIAFRNRGSDEGFSTPMPST